MDRNFSRRQAQPLAAALAGTSLLAAAMGIGRFAYTPLLPPMRATLGWTETQAGDIASANFLGYLIGALVATALAQRPERRLWLFVGMLLSVATTGAGAVVVSFATWAGIRFLSGVASAFCLVLGTVLIFEYLADRQRPHLAAVHFAGVGVGIIVSVLVLEVARRAGASLFGQWAALGLTSLLLLAGSWVVIRTLPRQVALVGSDARAVAHSPPAVPSLLKRLIIAYGLFGFGYVVTATFIVAIARSLDQSPVLEPLTWIVVGLLAAPSVLVWQRLAARLGPFTALRLAYALEASGVLLAGFASGESAVVAGGALLGGTFVAITALGLSAARAAAGSSQGRAIGWMTAAFGLGQLVGPAVAGRLAELTQGFTLPSLIAALLLVVAIVLLWGAED